MIKWKFCNYENANMDQEHEVLRQKICIKCFILSVKLLNVQGIKTVSEMNTRLGRGMN